MSDPIHTNKAPEPVGLYPHARRVGNLLFLSGIGPRIPGSNAIPGLEQDKNGNFTAFEDEPPEDTNNHDDGSDDNEHGSILL